MIKTIKGSKDKCRNCGLTWIDHYGSRCLSKYTGKDSLYEPVPLDTICAHCGQPLHKHRGNLICINKPTTFAYEEINLMLDKKLFEI